MQKPQIQIPASVSVEPIIMTPTRFIPKPKRRLYVDPEEMSWYIQQISMSLSPDNHITRKSIWPAAFL